MIINIKSKYSTIRLETVNDDIIMFITRNRRKMYTNRLVFHKSELTRRLASYFRMFK